MVISFTKSRVSGEQARQVEAFLAGFLPRLAEQQPGVEAIYHFHDDENGESTTAIIWHDEDARLAYRDSELIREPMALEEKLGLSSERTAFPLTFPA